MTDPVALAAVHGIAARYSAAVAAHDVDALALLYAPDVLVLDAFLPAPATSGAAWHDNIRDWFGGLDPAATTTAEFDVTRAGLDGALLWAAGTVRFRDLAADGSEQSAVTNRLSWVLRADGDSWSIVHEHTSLAVDLEAGKPIFG